MTTTTESTAATIADNPIKEPISEDKTGLEEVEEGELPEEGEITDDDEVESAKNQAENKPQGAPTTQQSQKQQHNERRSEYHSNKGGGRDSGVTWRKSFSGHHQQQFGRNNKFTPNRGGGNDGRYRDFDGRVAMKTDAQREEEMFDSWDRGVSRKNRAAHSHSSPKRSDISPIRTTPMIESAAAQGIKTEQVAQESPRKSEPVKQEAEMTAAAAAPLDDDMDFRGANVNQQIEQKEANVPADDVDFRRSSTSSNFPAGPPIAPPQPPFGNHSPPPFGTGPPRHFDGGNRRRPHSQSPPPRFRDDQQQIQAEFYEGSAAKRIRPFFHPEDEQRESSTPSRPGESEEVFGGGGFTPGGPFEGGPRQFQQQGEGGWSQGRGGFQNFNQRGRGGGTMGWGYRGGRPFFPRLICKFFREGFCRDAEKCTFSHATVDSHRQPQLCKYYQAGFCKKALFCQLMHGEWPCKAFHKGECTKEPCMFSHEPLDDVSRPIVEKMMEDERLGINTEQPPQPGTPHQFHNNFRGGHQQQQPGGGFYRPPRFYHQQGQGQPGIQQQHRFQHPQQHQSPHPPFPPHQQQPHPAGGMPVNFPPPPPPNSGEHQQLQQPPPHFGQSTHQQFMPDGGQQPLPQSSSFSPEFQQQHGIGTVPPPIPPPGLVLPPMLSGTPNSTIAQAQHPFGYFNPSGNVQQPPHPPHMHPPPTSGISIPPQPSFQQLQQQVQQQGITPHFPHQPSLLGPTATVPPGISQMPPNIQQQMMMESPIKQQQEFSGQSAAHMHESSLAFQQPTSSMDEQKKDVEKSPSDGGGGFNINQMLEQITREQSPPSSSPGTKKIVNFADPTMDLISSIGFGPGAMGLSGLLADDESPASPAVGTEQMHGDKPAAVIPVTCEWKLHIVDIPPPTDPNLHFDMKFIQQISSSNSDPRLRRLAEKQFDLVSKTLEKQQQQMASTSQQQQKECDGDSSIVSELLNRMEEPGAEGANVVADPRKDPRRKTKGGMEKTGKEDGSNSDQIATKSSQSSPAHFNTKSEPIGEEQQQTIGATTTNRNSPPLTSTTTTAGSIDEEMVQKQMAALMNAALGYGPSPMGIKPPPNFSTPPPGIQSHQISQMRPQSMSMAPHLGQQQFYTTPPPFVQHHPQASSSTFLMPNQPPTAQANPPQLFHGAGAMAAQIPPQPRLSNQQMLGAHAFNLGGTGQLNLSGATQVAANNSPPQSSMTGGGNNYHRGRRNGGTGGGGRQAHHQQPDSPKQQQQSSPQQQNIGSQSPQQKLPPAAPPTMSLREKRKNNEYESPLARLASSGHRQ